MKYTVLGFQQEKLIENGLCMDDALILRTIKDLYASSSMEFKDYDGIKYMWINYTYLSKQIPIIGKKRYLMGRIEAYGKEHLLLRVLEKTRKGQRGNFSYVSPTEKLDSLQDYDPYAQIAQGTLCTDRISLMHESHNKDTSISDTSINNIYTIFKLWNDTKIIVHRSMSDKLHGHINARLTDYSVDEILKAITNYSTILNGSQYYWSHKWTLGEFLTRGLDKFLDENKPLENFLSRTNNKDGSGKAMVQGDSAKELLRKQIEQQMSKKELLT